MMCKICGVFLSDKQLSDKLLCSNYVLKKMISLCLTGIFGLDGPGSADIIPSQGRSWCQCSIRHSSRLPIRLHCGIQWSFSIVWKRSQAVGWEAVPQGVSQLKASEPIWHPTPPGLQGGGVKHVSVMEQSFRDSRFFSSKSCSRYDYIIDEMCVLNWILILTNNRSALQPTYQLHNGAIHCFT